MQEIKFRLRINNKIIGYEKWYCGSGEEAKPQWLYSKDNKYWSPEYIYHNEKDNFIGLLDKLGTEIYEGDITINERYVGTGGMVFSDFTGVIVFRNGSFVFDSKPVINHGISGYNHILKVIGNIYEHPNLIKEEKV